MPKSSNKRTKLKAHNVKFMAAKKTKANTKTGSSFNKSKSSTNPNRADPAGGKAGSQFRTKATINRLNMYKEKPDLEKRKLAPTDPSAGRIQPDRRWFGNVRTVDQKELERYRQNLESQQVKKGSGVSVLVRNKKLPLSLVKEAF
jgi:nuclear GTP-binding protein